VSADFIASFAAAHTSVICALCKPSQARELWLRDAHLNEESCQLSQSASRQVWSGRLSPVGRVLERVNQRACSMPASFFIAMYREGLGFRHCACSGTIGVRAPTGDDEPRAIF
jgi:hypothetical protein